MTKSDDHDTSHNVNKLVHGKVSELAQEAYSNGFCMQCFYSEMATLAAINAVVQAVMEDGKAVSMSEVDAITVSLCAHIAARVTEVLASGNTTPLRPNNSHMH